MANHSSCSLCHHFFLHGLADIYSAEQQITAQLAKMAEMAQNSELRKLFTAHAEENKQHVACLEQLSKEIDHQFTTKPHQCITIKAMIDEMCQCLTTCHPDEHMKDIALIYSARKIEHYEIATYSSLCKLKSQDSVCEKFLTYLKKMLHDEEKMDAELLKILHTISGEMK